MKIRGPIWWAIRAQITSIWSENVPEIFPVVTVSPRGVTKSRHNACPKNHSAKAHCCSFDFHHFILWTSPLTSTTLFFYKKTEIIKISKKWNCFFTKFHKSSEISFNINVSNGDNRRDNLLDDWNFEKHCRWCILGPKIFFPGSERQRTKPFLFHLTGSQNYLHLLQVLF